MAQERIFTGEDRDWLKENYPHLSNTACQRHLKCAIESLKKLVAECGLTYKGANTNVVVKKEKNPIWQDAGTKGCVCLDCDNYVHGGLCSKTGKWVGALWQKKCFKPK